MLSKEALSHRTYVEKILRYYRENDIQQGDPNEGKWEEAHYPLPSRLGGQTVVLLLREHHAVQGVLQSEEYQCCCMSGMYMKYLEGTEYRDRASYWLGESLRVMNKEEWSDERRQKHGEVQRERFRREPVTQETKDKMSLSRTGLKYAPRTEEHTRNLSRALTGKKKGPLSADALANRLDTFVIYNVKTGTTTVITGREKAAERVQMNKVSLTTASKTSKLCPLKGKKRRPVKCYLIKKL